MRRELPLGKMSETFSTEADPVGAASNNLNELIRRPMAALPGTIK